MSIFTVYRTENATIIDRIDLEAWGIRHAAEEWARLNWNQAGCPESMECVVVTANGTKWINYVEVELEPAFHSITHKIVEVGADDETK